MTELPPQYIAGEKAVLGAVLLDEAALHRISGVIGTRDFYREGHRIIFLAMNRLAERDVPIDLATLTAELKDTGKLEAAGGVESLIELQDCTPSAANVLHYATVVREKSVLRGVVFHIKLTDLF